MNQALEFLINEHQMLDDYRNEILQESFVIPDVSKSILENNLYGVDINEEAVEIAKLSLWLRTAEKDRKLSDLNSNIKCGNSLIDDPEVAGEKAFNWEKEFPDIMNEGGFDVVIGNPPYVRGELLENKDYLIKKFEVGNGSADLYSYFYECGFNLLRESGKLGFITSNTFLRTNYGRELRNFINSRTNISKLFDFGDSQFFKGASTRTAITILSKDKTINPTINYLEFENKIIIEDFYKLIEDNNIFIDRKYLSNDVWSFKNIKAVLILNKLYSNNLTFDKYTNRSVKRGIVTGFNKAFVISKEERDRIISKDSNSKEIIKKWIVGSDIHKWVYDSTDDYLIFTRRGINIDNLPKLKEHLQEYYEQLRPKTSKKDKYGRKPGNYEWYEIQDSIDYYLELDKPKIIYANMAQSNRFAVDYSGGYIKQKAFYIPFIDYYLLGILNSSLIFFIVKNKFPRLLGNTYEFTYKNHMENLPIAIGSNEVKNKIEEKTKLNYTESKKLKDFIEKFLSILLSNFTIDKLSNKLKEFYNYDFKTFLSELKKKKVTLSLKQQEEWEEYFNEYKTEINALLETIAQTDKEIDKMVYELYGLTDDEIKIVEESVG